MDVLIILQNANLAVLIVNFCFHQDYLVAKLRLVIDVDFFFIFYFFDDSLNLFDDFIKLWKVNSGFGFLLPLLINLKV